ncbi:MAG: hypothetical protein GQ525_14635 [Draconibacterium sp.]|nr:hypothetical protein [Draconibacterium sp.]
MKSPLSIILTIFIFCLLFSIGEIGFAQNSVQKEFEISELNNPITVSFLKKNLTKKSPKLILTPQIEKELKRKLKSDPLVQRYYQYLKDESIRILEEPFLKRELLGFRMLGVSRDMVERMGTLCMVYRVDKSSEILNRIDDELKAVCSFKDWNNQHFLDVAEMSFAVALAIDWVGKWLPKETVQLAKISLIEKGIKPSFNEGGTRMYWISSNNNWNAVCHGGMIAAALVTADINPELSAKTISRALEKLPGSLSEYAPDGIYPEGPTYWGYGTSYTVLAASSLRTALGSDFGILQSPGFMESANFILQVRAPSDNFFNFADSKEKKEGRAILLSWFAAKTGDGLYFDKLFFENPEGAGRFAGLGLVWLSQFSQQKTTELPLNWHGKGINPVAVFRGEKEDAGQFYLAAKGGKAQLGHGNMDAGTFVFELNGVRWVIDPGTQTYYLLEKVGFNLSGLCQDCDRWTLLTKRNDGHSTITINDSPFNVQGYAPITDFKADESPEVTIDMTDLYFGNISSFQRKFVKESNQSFVIEDSFEINDSTKNITWGLMTFADVIPVKNGAVLKQDGEELRLTILSPEEIQVSVISLDPPPLEIDKTIENLKRIEIRVPAWIFKDNKGFIKVRLSGE